MSGLVWCVVAAPVAVLERSKHKWLQLFMARVRAAHTDKRTGRKVGRQTNTQTQVASLRCCHQHSSRSRRLGCQR